MARPQPTERIGHSMKDKDLNQIAAVEKAIAEKYGAEAIVNPKSKWNELKEKEYLSQMREFYQKIKKNEEHEEKIDINGIKVSKKLLNRESLTSCIVCGTFQECQWMMFVSPNLSVALTAIFNMLRIEKKDG